MGLCVQMVITCDAPGCDVVHECRVELEQLREWIDRGGRTLLLPGLPSGWRSRGPRGCRCPIHAEKA